MASVAANGATLYQELRGSGPPVSFIAGATGDAGHWTEVADAPAGEYTVSSKASCPTAPRRSGSPG